ncbi:MAG: HAD hydrolase-like protein [Clostridiales bacterium]|nr:HAD hydrolase-like protein [Clostridiales bacterium]
MKYKKILFDLDGTIIDSQAGITKSAQYALKRFGIIVDDLEELIPFIGPPLKDSFMDRYGFSEQDAIQAVKYYREYFADHGVFANTLYPGIEDLLRRLHSEGRLLFIATTKPTIYTEQILDEYKLSHLFSYVCGANLDGTRTDKSEIIKTVIDESKISIEDTVMIGDRKYDIIGAYNNKIDSIAVGYGFGSEEELRATNPTQYVKTVKDLYAAL